MGNKKTFGMIFSGAGYLDGSEIQEAVIAMVALSEAKVTVRFFAPNVALKEVDHQKGAATGKERNVTLEVARITRGNVEDLASASGADVDGWIIPGGFGAAKNLCDFAEKGTDAIANKDVSRVVREALAANLPIGACCIAPVLLALVTKKSGPRLVMTIGTDEGTAKALGALGAKHQEAKVTDIVVDDEHRVVTSPAYMDGDASIADVAAGIHKMVKQAVKWA
ncbi:MAG: isoprenoid biosynthesis glyoxalase ElbB [Deltaproteobacteria bacterium]|nr:isoprenoid biosynthesis glyoxalase ElbB [Deltaproteobacteria bacterium]